MWSLSVPAIPWAVAAMTVAPLPGAQVPPVDAQVRSVVDAFFAAQQAEDVEAYLALWSARAQRPRAEQLKFIFDSGDDRFSELAVHRVLPVGDLIRVRLSVLRERTITRPGRQPSTMTSRPLWNLTLVREAGALKVMSEGAPADDLAAALIAATTPDLRQELLTSEPDLLDSRLASALSRRADVLAQSQRFAEAIDIYELVVDVATRAGDAKAEGEALQNIGNAYYFQRKFPEARRAYEARLAVERASGNDTGAAHALLGVATVRYSLYEYADALVAYREALALYERVGDEAGMASALISTGNVQYLQGDYGGAVADYGRSRDLHRKALDTDGEARALDGLGRVHTARGDYAAALEAYAGVREEGRARGNRPMLGAALQSIGDVHLRLGNLDAARTAFEESRDHHEFLKDLASAGRAWQGIALTDLVAGLFASAEQGYSKSESACRAARDHDCAARAVVGAAFAQESQDLFDRAIASYRKAIDEFTALKKPEDAVRAEIGLSKALFGKTDYEAARAAALRARDQATVPDVLWRSHLAEARALRRLGEPARAMAAAQQAAVVVQRMAEESLRFPSRRLARDTSSAYAFLAVLQAEAGEAAAAFDTLERRLSHALRIVLANHEREIARGMDAEARGAEREAAIRVMSLEAQLAKQRELPKPDLARIADLEARLAEAARARAGQQARMFERWPGLRIWRGLAAPATTADLPYVLAGDDRTLVTFAIDDDDLLAVTARLEEGEVRLAAHLAETSRQSLAEVVAAATRPDTLRDVVAWREAAAGLVRALPRAVVEALFGARQLTVVPDDVLWRVPFEALPGPDGYLGDRADVSYAGSLTALVTSRGMAPAVAETPLLAIGAPEVSQERVSRLGTTAPGWVLRAAEAAARELRVASEPFDEPAATILSGAAATEAALRAAAASAAALHVALPFRLNSASPLFSPAIASTTPPVALQGTGSRSLMDPPAAVDTADDGVLEAREIINLDLRAAVAVLSDGSALSMRDAAAASPALQWAWRAAGVPHLVLARWPVDAAVTRVVLGEFYARIRAGDSPVVAMATARRRARAAAPSGPWYWAGWMVTGQAAAIR